MTDQELLEKAARACGVTHPKILKDHLQGWNPLEDDGDAFRLCMKMNIKTSVYKDAIQAGEAVVPYALSINRCKAARRAIVRAAAAMADDQ